MTLNLSLSALSSSLRGKCDGGRPSSPAAVPPPIAPLRFFPVDAAHLPSGERRWGFLGPSHPRAEAVIRPGGSGCPTRTEGGIVSSQVTNPAADSNPLDRLATLPMRLVSEAHGRFDGGQA